MIMKMTMPAALRYLQNFSSPPAAGSRAVSRRVSMVGDAAEKLAVELVIVMSSLGNCGTRIAGKDFSLPGAAACQSTYFAISEFFHSG